MLSEIKVIDGRIIPALYLLPCDPSSAGFQPAGFPWPYHPELRGYIAFDDRERDDLVAALTKAGLEAKPQPLDQPDPALLAACQGLYTSRSEALAALATGNPPVTVDSLAGKLAEIDDRVKAVEAKTAKD